MLIETRWLGKQDGRDGYDAVEFISQQPWCTGKIGLAGNSWLAQYFIAAEQPPHLAGKEPRTFIAILSAAVACHIRMAHSGPSCNLHNTGQRVLKP